VVGADTKTTPDSGTTTASRTTYAVGNAIIKAADRLRAELGQKAVGLQGVSVRETYHVPVAEVELGDGLPHILYSYGTHVVLAEVNTLTGDVAVVALEAFLDGGRVIFRTGFEGQSEGGAAQGIGYALFEEVLLDRGRFQNTNFDTYVLPTSLDVPAEIRTVPVEVKEPTGPFGAKGISETATVGVAPAILNALHDAIGVRFTRLPVRAEDILRALQEQRR
jgi:CO/xanthine dehydrogenase Mo-binding subunit